MLAFLPFLVASVTISKGIHVFVTIRDGCFILGDGKKSCIAIGPYYQVDLSEKIEVDGVTDYVWAINHYAFANSNIISIKLPHTIHQIGIAAFCNCSLLTELDLSKTSIVDIPADMLCGAKSLITLLLPEQLRSIGSRALQQTKLTYLNLYHIEYIDPTALVDCNNLINIVTNGNYHFSNNTLFKEREIIRVFPVDKNYKISQTANRIGCYAFFGCYIKKLMIPQTIQSIGSFAFLNSHIDSIQFHKKIKLDMIERSTFENACLSSIELPLSTTKLLEKAFFNSSLQIVDLKQTKIRAISRECFANCIHLTKIIFPLDLTKICAFAFSNTAITEMILRKSVITIDPYSFAYSKLNLVDLMRTQITYLPEKAFAYCNSLETIFLPNGLRNIHQTCFVDDYSITDVIYCGSNAIKESVFYGNPTVRTLVHYPGKELSAIQVKKSDTCIYSNSLHNKSVKLYVHEKHEFDNAHSNERIDSLDPDSSDSEDMMLKIGKVIGIIGLSAVSICIFFL